MASAAYSLLFLFVLVFLRPIVRAQDHRAPHGLAYESPADAISPEAYAFFNPAVTQPKNTTTLFPGATSVQSNPARDSMTTPEGGGGRGAGAGGMAGILIGFLFVVVLALGVYSVVTTRKRNWNKANAALPLV